MTTSPPEVYRYTSTVEALAAPDASEELLLQLSVTALDHFYALAGRAQLTPRVRARVHSLAAAAGWTWSVDPAGPLIAGINAAGTTRAELRDLASEFGTLRNSTLVAQAVSALRGHAACDDGVLAMGLSTLRGHLPVSNWRDAWEAAVVALEPDPAAALAARAFTHTVGDRSSSALAECLAAARALDAAGRQVAETLLAQRIRLDDPAGLLLAAGQVAT